MVELNAADNKAARANELLATILKEDPKDSDAIAMRAALMLSTGNKEQINLATADLQSLVTKMPQNHLIRFNLARALMAKGDVEGARQQLEEAIKLRPDFVVARELLGKIYLHTGESAKALKAADEILALDRNNLQGHLDAVGGPDGYRRQGQSSRGTGAHPPRRFHRTRMPGTNPAILPTRKKITRRPNRFSRNCTRPIPEIRAG